MSWLKIHILNQILSAGAGRRREKIAQGTRGAILAGRSSLGSWQVPRTQPCRGRGGAWVGQALPTPPRVPTCCWAWILMYSALCLPCLPLSGLPAWPWTAFSREAPGVTTFMGGTLPPPLCRKRDRVGVGGGMAPES